MPPCVELSGADPVLARHLGRRQISAVALRHDLPLLLHRPTPPTLAPCDDLQSWRTSALTTTRMSALIFSDGLGGGIHRNLASLQALEPQCARVAPLTIELARAAVETRTGWEWAKVVPA